MYSYMKGSTHELASLEIAIKAIPDDPRVWGPAGTECLLPSDVPEHAGRPVHFRPRSDVS